MMKLCSTLFFIFFIPIMGDTLILKSGVFFKGKTVRQDKNEIVFKKSDGNETSYAKNSVLKVIYKDLDASEVKKILQQETKKTVNNLPMEPIPEKKVPLTTDDILKKELSKPGNNLYTGNRWSPVWRSSIFPGWGQWYGKERILGLGIGIVFFGAVSYLGTSYQEMNNNLQERDTASRNGNLALFVFQPSLSSLGTLYVTQQIYANQYNKADDAYNNSIAQVVTAVGAVTAVYALQILHSIYLGNKLVSEREKQIKSMNSTGFNFDSKIERINGMETNQLNTIFTLNYSVKF